MGAEGGNVTYAESSHAALWNEGLITRRENGSAEFTPVAGGLGDWGNLYALSSFNDTKNNRRVQIGWAPEDFVGDEGLFSATQQGFQGSHSLLRELFVHEVSGVVNADGELTTNRNALLTKQSDGTFLAQTLGVRPLPDVVKGLRGGEGCTHHSYGGSKTYSSSHLLKKSGAAQIEIQATVSSATGACGLIFAADPTMTEYTTIIYEPSNHTLLVERAYSSTIDEFNNATVTGYFYPYTIASEDGSTAQESITMDVFVDGSLVEVYINERFALTTRIYPSMECSTGYGVYVADGATATFESVHAWENLLHVWTDRPANSSSPLVFDTAAETNDYTWWSGN
jgi:beta-fructofuranosidase